MAHEIVIVRLVCHRRGWGIAAPAMLIIEQRRGLRSLVTRSQTAMGPPGYAMQGLASWRSKESRGSLQDLSRLAPRGWLRSRGMKGGREAGPARGGGCQVVDEVRRCIVMAPKGTVRVLEQLLLSSNV